MNILKNLKKNIFFKNAFILSKATFISYVITAISLPVLSRLYLPEDFGNFGTLISICSLLVIISSLRYETAIPLTKNLNEAFKLVILSFLILLFFIISLFAVYILSFLFLPNIENRIWLDNNIYLVLSFIFLGGLYKIINFLLLRLKDFNFLAKIKMTEFFFRFLFQILLVFLGYIGLFVGYLISLIIPVVFFFSKYTFYKKKYTVNELKQVASKYKVYPKFSTIESLTNQLSYYLPTIFLLPFFGPTYAGYYFFSITIMSIPSTFVGQSINKVYYSLAAKKNEKNFKKLFTKISENIIKLVFPSFFVVLFSLQEIIPLIFGENWRQAGIFCSFMCVWFYFKIIYNSLDNTVNLKKKIKDDFFLKLLFLIIQSTALFFGIYLGDFYLTVKLIILASTISILINVGWIHYIVKIRLRKVIKIIFSNIFMSFLFSIPILLSYFFKTEGILKFLLYLVSYSSVICFVYIYNFKKIFYFEKHI